MALKRQHDTQSMFSMSSMTDIVFLLLIFFMVTSTFVFPSALEVNLPQSAQNTQIKPSTRIYIDKDQKMYYTVADSVQESKPIEIQPDQLESVLAQVKLNCDSLHQFVSLHADEAVPYGKIVEVLDKGSKQGLKIVLATKPSAEPTNETVIPREDAVATEAPAAQPAAATTAPAAQPAATPAK